MRIPPGHAYELNACPRRTAYLCPTTNPDPRADRFQNRAILKAIRAGVGRVWEERDYRNQLL